MSEEILHTFKGVNKDMSAYGGFIFEPGKEYEVEGEIKVCGNGFHACAMPLNVFEYFPPTTSRYFEAEQSGDIEHAADDTKIASRKIKLGAEIGIPGLVKAQIEYVKEHSDKSQPAASNTGDSSVASNTGDWSVASNTGDWSVASNTGDWSVVSNTGHRSVASNTGDWSVVSNTGYKSVASNAGKGGVAIVTGYRSKARGAIGSAICICERGNWNGTEYPLLAIKAAIVDGENIKADTWYTLKNGEFVEEVDDESN